MALLNWTITAYLPIIIFISIRLRAADGALIVKPQDTFVLAGQLATLNCSTSSTDDVHWYYGTSYTYVYAGRKLISPFNNRLKVEVYQNDGTTAFNLVFLSTQPVDAGTYICGDIQGRGETSSAEMTVFTAAGGNGICQSNMKPDGVVIPNDCNIDPDEVKFSCSVTFYGKNPPKLEWKKVPEDGNSVENTDCQTINNRITCNVSSIGNRQLNGSSYECRAAGSAGLNISICNIPVKNLLYAFSGKTTLRSFVGNEVQCNSETSQSCYYKWKHSDTVIYTSRTITPDKTGLYQCEANCTIRGKQCIVFGYVYTSGEDSTACPAGCVAGICLGILILIVVTIILVIVIRRFLLKKENGKRQQLLNCSPNERDLEKKSAQTDTQPEEASLIQPDEKSETNCSPNERDLEKKSAQTDTQPEEASLIQPDEKSETNEPKLLQTLVPKAASKQRKAVFGVAILGDALFVLSHEHPAIEVFENLEQLESKREVLLKGYQLQIPWDIQSNSMDEYLYIVDVKRDEEQTTTIIKIDKEGNVKHHWPTNCQAGRLSVTKSEFNVIVTSLYIQKVEEYSANGKLICSIELPSGIASPWVTLKRKDNEYIISHGNHGNSIHRVCVINKNGNIKHYFGGEKGSDDEQLNVPVHMAVFSDGHILIADKDNSRVVMLSPELKFTSRVVMLSQELKFSQGDNLRFPNRICLDEENKRLFVSENKWVSNMKPWVDGKVLVFDMSTVLAS